MNTVRPRSCFSRIYSVVTLDTDADVSSGEKHRRSSSEPDANRRSDDPHTECENSSNVTRIFEYRDEDCRIS